MHTSGSAVAQRAGHTLPPNGSEELRPQTGLDEQDGASEHFDVIIVGAGLSGICAAYHLQTRFPKKRIVLLEGRAALGGTWDLFRYPGVRSDSDMFTLGYGFRSWTTDQALVDGPSIRDYIRDTAHEFGIHRKIRLCHRVASAAWDSGRASWMLQVLVGAGVPVDSGGNREAVGHDDSPGQSPVSLSCNFLLMCSGYYDYRDGYMPPWAGVDLYKGILIHPQHWPEKLDYAGCRILVIGSGATAVTLVPALARHAAHVTLLQRSPTYIVARAAHDRFASWLQKWLPRSTASHVVRWKNIVLGAFFYTLARRRPDLMRRLILKGVEAQLGTKQLSHHFRPTYNPWDQRLCLVPDGDFFTAVRTGVATVVTDEIASFTATGVILRSGQQLDADIVIAATGLKVQLFGGMKILLDGVAKDVSTSLAYKGMMYSDVPNLASAFGYTNASWTLKAELTAKYVCRLLAYMDARHLQSCTPRPRVGDVASKPAVDLNSGYILRAAKILPKQGAKPPWQVRQNYFRDLLSLKFARVDDGVLCFGRHNPVEHQTKGP